jgi:hypothetical protein
MAGCRTSPYFRLVMKNPEIPHVADIVRKGSVLLLPPKAASP